MVPKNAGRRRATGVVALRGHSRHTWGVRPAPRPFLVALRRVLVAAAALAATTALVGGCSDGSGGGSGLVSMHSNTRPTASAGTGASGGPGSGGGTDPTSAFCRQLRKLDGEGSLAGKDPAAAVEALSRVGDVAPPALRGDVATLAGAVKELAGIDRSDPASIDKVLAVAARPEVLAASGRITDAARTECGLDLGSKPTGTSDRGGAAASGDLNLEDVDAVRSAAKDTTWPDKLTSTSIINDTAVELSADASSGLTADEAVQACTAVRSALVKKNPKVTITIRSGETVLARAVEDAPCARA
jgi:hypothetical protein